MASLKLIRIKQIYFWACCIDLWWENGLIESFLWSGTIKCNLVVCSTDRSKAVVPVLVLLFVALWFILRGNLLYVFPCVILFLCFSVLLVLRLPRLGKREIILVLFVCLFGLCLFMSVSSSSWGLGRAAVCDCGTPWTFALPFWMVLFIFMPLTHCPLLVAMSKVDFKIGKLKHYWTWLETANWIWARTTFIPLIYWLSFSSLLRLVAMAAKISHRCISETFGKKMKWCLLCKLWSDLN